MSENVSVFRAINAVSDGGLHHKSVAVKGEVARIFDLVVTQMGAERVMGRDQCYKTLFDYEPV